MKILVNAIAAAPGGGLTNALGLLEGWSANGFLPYITIIACHPEILSRMKSYGGTAVSVPPRSVMRRSIWEAKNIRILIDRYSSEVLMNMNYIVPWVKIPQVIQHQSLTTFVRIQASSTRGAIRRLAQRYAASVSIRKAAANVFTSHYLRRSAEAATGGSSADNHVIPYGVSRNLLEHSQRARHAHNYKSYRISALQSPAEYKDNESLLKALQVLIQRRPHEPWHLDIAGSYDWTRWKIRAEELRVSDRVSWLGFLREAEIIQLLSESHCLIFPSVFEAFGLPIVEAMACGCPVVAANATAVPEIANGAAMLVPPRDPKAIVEAILQLQDDNNFRQELIERGKAHVSGLTWESTVASLQRVFELVA